MKTFRTLALVLGLSLVTPSCQLFRAKDPTAVVVDAAPAIYDTLVVGLSVLDLLQAHYVKNMPPMPTVEDLEMVRTNIARLDAARQSLMAIKVMIEKDEVSADKLVPHVQIVVDNLMLVVDDLEKAGVKVPENVKDGLKFVQKYLKLLA